MDALLPLLLLLAVSYMLLIRPQQRQLRARRALVASLEVGDEVVTAGGIVGRIAALDDGMAAVDVAPGVQLRVLRGAISQKVEPEHPDVPGVGEGEA